jgi:hypothetical protein
MTLGKLHDATLDLLKFDWRQGTLQITLRTGVGEFDTAVLEVSGVSDLRCPRLLPWGPSSSINCTKLEQLTDASYMLTIEMQSGDVIEVRCRDISIELASAKQIQELGESTPKHIS